MPHRENRLVKCRKFTPVFRGYSCGIDHEWGVEGDAIEPAEYYGNLVAYCTCEEDANMVAYAMNALASRIQNGQEQAEDVVKQIERKM